MVWNFNGGYVINRSLNDRLERRNFSACVEKCFACSLRWLQNIFHEEKFRISLKPCIRFCTLSNSVFGQLSINLCLSVLYVWRGYQFTFTALLIIHKFVTRIAWTIVPRLRFVTLLQTVSVIAFTSTWKKCITSVLFRTGISFLSADKLTILQ